MPRKQKHQDAFRKTSLGYVHPAMEASIDSSAPHDSESSVNTRIEYLRGVQGRPAVSISSDELLRSTHAPVRAKKRMAGPPPPRSWIEHNAASNPNKRGNAARKRPTNLDHHFPGIMIPNKTSLVHVSLKALASDWDQQVEFSSDWLSTLPRHLKTLLLTYIARYGPEDGISLTGLRYLLSGEADTGSDESTGCHDITRLDLGGSYGRRISARSLRAYLVSAGGQNTESSRRKKKTTDAPPESWDQDGPLSLSLEAVNLHSSSAFYEHLTHLSLEDPGPVSWSEFVDVVCPYLGRVTHLSLAHWPSPKPENVLPDAARGVSISDDDMEQLGRYRLQCLSRSTSQLQYLCLGGCHAWLDLLRLSAPGLATASPVAPNRNTQRIAAAFGDATDVSHSESRRAKPAAGDEMFVTSWRKLAILDLVDTHMPIPGPERMDVITLADTLCKREPYRSTKRATAVDTSAARVPIVRVPTAEGGYRLMVADWRLESYMSMHAQTRQWIMAEHEKIKLVRYIKQVRGTGHGLTAEYGGGREALLAAGWREAELFSVGL